MLLTIIPFMAVLAVCFVPLVLLEAFWLKRGLGLTWIPALQGSLVVNLASGLFGVPGTWLLLFLVQVSTGGLDGSGIDTFWGKLATATWHAPYVPVYESSTGSIYLFVTLYLSIVFFACSWFIEGMILKWIFKPEDSGTLWRCTRNANLISFLLMYFVLWYF